MATDQARAYLISNGQTDRRTTATSLQWLPYQEQVQLKKIAQRRERRKNEEKSKKVVIGILNVGTMTGRG